jgi:hypothetical protein
MMPKVLMFFTSVGHKSWPKATGSHEKHPAIAFNPGIRLASVSGRTLFSENPYLFGNSVFTDQGDRTGAAYDVIPIPPVEVGEQVFCEIAARPYECRSAS